MSVELLKHSKINLARILLLFSLSGMFSVSAIAQVYYDHSEFAMGADLSYVNHIQERGAEWREKGRVSEPYKLFASHGGNVVRLRIWHNPQWVEQAYIDAGETDTKMYHDFFDVKEAIRRSKAEGLAVCLDFHYSDTWADPGDQHTPAAWVGLSFDLVKDSIYEYTYKTLSALDSEGLMPEYVQVGNEINPGFVHPYGKKYQREDSLAILLNSGIRGIRDAGSLSEIKPEIIIHIAQPENVKNWFVKMVPAGLTDFDIIGFSYYGTWSDVPLGEISEHVKDWKDTFGKDVMCVETSYLWYLSGNEPANNERAQMEPDFWPSVTSQKNYLLTLTWEIIDGGGRGIMPWEPFFVGGHDMITPWGRGRSRQSRTFFNYNMRNEVLSSIDYMNHPYEGLNGQAKRADSVDITIRLNISFAGERVDTFYIEGSPTAGTKVPMNLTGVNTLEIKRRLPVGSFQVFRFYKGSAHDTLPEKYRIGNPYDRGFTVPGRPVELEYQFYGAGDDISISSSRKNVLLIIVDDLRPELGSYGSRHAKTPNFDALAAGGVQFNAAYCQYPVCRPSRTSFMSGLRPEVKGPGTIIDQFDPEHVTMPDLFLANGYYTASVGKVYHGKGEDADGWNYRWKGAPWQGYGNPENYNLPYQPVLEREDLPDSNYSSGQVTLETIRVMQENKNHPFFIAAGFWKPHLPFAAPKKYWDLYNRDSLDVSSFRGSPAGRAPVAHAWTELAAYHPYEWLDTISDQSSVQLSDEQARELRHGYLACVSFIDAQAGMLMDELKSLGLERNTIIAFWSDHGFHLGDQAVWAKHTLYERANWIPLIIYDPAAGFQPAASGQFAELVDVYPTLAELCGLPVPSRTDGKSLVPIMESRGSLGPSHAFNMYRPHANPYKGIYGQTIRTGNYRYTEWQDHANGRTPVYRELYNVPSGGDESENLIEKQGIKTVVDSLSSILNDSLDIWYGPIEGSLDALKSVIGSGQALQEKE